MKIISNLLVLTAVALGLAAPAQAQVVNVEVGDSNAPWLGFMNVFDLPSVGGSFVFGSPWGTSDLVATFDDGANTLDLTPNTIGDPDPFWYQGGGAPGNPGNKYMEANLYQEKTGAYAGQTVTFTYSVLSDTTTSAHIGNAYIKDFAPDYSSSIDMVVPLTVGNNQSISLPISNDPARHTQFGFQFIGENVWVTDVAPFGGIQIQTNFVAPPAPFGPYHQDFEGLTQSDGAALGDDGWLVYGEVYDVNNVFQYVTASGEPAPNVNGPGAAYSNIATGEGGVAQGAQYLNAFSDYECCAEAGNGPEGHNNPTDIVRSVLYQEYEINESDVGRELEFQFDIKLPTDTGSALASPSTAEVFMRNIDGSGIDVDVAQDVTTISGLNATTWTTHSLAFSITADMVGDLFQFGIESSSSNFDPTGVYLDNISLDDAGGINPDFDGDGDNDGSDFLEWQRSDGTSAGLAAWQGSYPQPGTLAAVASVPEPSTAMAALLAFVTLAATRRHS